jgi:hypothetical protein
MKLSVEAPQSSASIPGTGSLTATCASWLDTTAAREVRDQRKHKENYEHEEYQFRNTCGRDGYAGKAQDPRDQCYDQEY